MISGPCGLAPVSFSAAPSCRPNACARCAAAAAAPTARAGNSRDRNPASNRARHPPGKRRRWCRPPSKPQSAKTDGLDRWSAMLHARTHPHSKSDARSRAYSSNPESSNPVARYSFVVADAKSVHQRKPSNTGAFRPKRNKKASHSVKRPGHRRTVSLPVRLSAHYIGGEPRLAAEISMTSKAIGKCDKKWRNLALAVLGV